MTIRILIGDALARLREIPDDSVHCCVTSPPYWGLRDYGVEGQIGLEETPEAYVARMVEVFAEVRRVLRGDGTCWVNLGDSYAGSWGNQGRKEERGTQRPINAPMMQNLAPYPDKRTRTGSWVNDHPTLKPKDLVGIPWRVAFALQADGWWLRSDIIWHKPNPMPESVTDRPTKSHEYVFLITKNDRYAYDSDAIREPDSGTDHPRFVLDGPSLEPSGGLKSPHRGIRTAEGRNGQGRNARSVWTIAPQPFPGSHFATMPPALAERCIKAGCPSGGTVLDPFGGAGTTGLVADRLQRNAVLIELSPVYAEMARARIQGDAPLTSVVEVAA
jgi:DNA modification methylase